MMKLLKQFFVDCMLFQSRDKGDFFYGAGMWAVLFIIGIHLYWLYKVLV